MTWLYIPADLTSKPEAHACSASPFPSALAHTGLARWLWELLGVFAPLKGAVGDLAQLAAIVFQGADVPRVRSSELVVKRSALRAARRCSIASISTLATRA